ncbi:putative quinol monooxygenase [Saccharomonospora piscinae]|uniref:putative quinol monooxygenase n=1 Tax=Saccharomonospora piscinae TaxID=687388 RepID=UPI0004655F89|nr:antibiotic biosynthesis monooxygenase family protein [Saccharomonospora piscinae]TLW90748.1 antibiotic biosynthesis monooxygenase [Saccharomonospora piscinae]
MLIITGYLTVDPAQRDAFVAAHHDLLARARRAPGCLDIAITADPLDPARVNNLERWESREHIDAWRRVANAPDTGIAIRSDTVMEYSVDGVRPPFG